MKAKSGPLFVGGVFEDPQTRRLVYVEDGAHERDGRVSNHWTLREIASDGSLGRSYTSYGWTAVPIPAEIEIKVKIRPQTKRRSIVGVIMTYGVFEVSVTDAELTPVFPGKPNLRTLEPNQTTLAPDGKTVLRVLSRFGNMIRFQTEPKQTRAPKITCALCNYRKPRKTAHFCQSGYICADCWDRPIPESLNLAKEDK